MTLAEMFSIKLKFTVDCLKFWFERNLKILEVQLEEKMIFKSLNSKQKDTISCLCDFPLDSTAENGWKQQVFKAECLFLENIYSKKEMIKMGIDNFEIYCEKLSKILDELDIFRASVESENLSSQKTNEQNIEINAVIEKISKIKTSKQDDGKSTKEKTIGFLYQHAIKFLPTDKIKGNFVISEKFLPNMISIFKNEHVLYHSHVTGKIIGYAHQYCNLQTRENYYTIPVFAHNQFRFDFFLFLKGIRPRVWETPGIEIGGKNPTSVNFAIIRNQVRFIDTVKYFPQSLGSLPDSMTDVERENIRKVCRRFLAEKLMFLTDEDEKWVFDYLSSGKGMCCC